MLTLHNLTKSYPTPDGGRLRVLNELTLTVERGRSMAIVGPSGCGKSTLLNIIGALDEPTGGEVIFEGRSYAGLSADERATLRRNEIGFVFQLHHLLPQCTVLDNVLLPTLGSDRTQRRQARDKAMALLELVGLAAFSDYAPGQLSGGQRQRVAVARALINDPTLLLADEPTGSLDQATSETIMDLLCELNRRRGLTLIMVTHAMDHARRMQVIQTLDRGTLIETQTDHSTA